MTLTFNPALQTTTALPVVPGGHASFRFSTSFASRDAYERARKDGSRLEMWTNLPVGGKSGKEWHALAFSYPDVDVAATASATEDADDDEKVFVVSPATSNIAHKRDNTAVVLDLTLTNARLGAVYSFTYRLVRASGAIEWLGAYGQNGDLVIQEKDVRLTLAEGCRFEQGDIVSRYAGAGAVTVATLDMLTDWVCWSLNADGYVRGLKFRKRSMSDIHHPVNAKARTRVSHCHA
ncbi:hypothetical protein BC835DRAFT_68869 [Cytidiella melzeri]|nr:hypothetical protein BC835DRAFT_68869 [Cytidiella melzeri]